jgi:hypothetical protein
MVLVIEKKNMEGVWWKYGVMLPILQIVPWILVGYKFNPGLDLRRYFTVGAPELVIFFAAGFLPFMFARLGWHTLKWFTLAGFVVAGVSYFFLLLFEPLRYLPNFAYLPSAAYTQFYTILGLIGALIQFGGYVFRKVFEE